MPLSLLQPVLTEMNKIVYSQQKQCTCLFWACSISHILASLSSVNPILIQTTVNLCCMQIRDTAH